eukprot:1793474-Rhodomonas_salina.1
MGYRLRAGQRTGEDMAACLGLLADKVRDLMHSPSAPYSLYCSQAQKDLISRASSACSTDSGSTLNPGPGAAGGGSGERPRCGQLCTGIACGCGTGVSRWRVVLCDVRY